MYNFYKSRIEPKIFRKIRKFLKRNSSDNDLDQHPCIIFFGMLIKLFTFVYITIFNIYSFLNTTPIGSFFIFFNNLTHVVINIYFFLSTIIAALHMYYLISNKSENEFMKIKVIKVTILLFEYLRARLFCLSIINSFFSLIGYWSFIHFQERREFSVLAIGRND
jgi:hypothetical protein